jgi:hypothetical protein
LQDRECQFGTLNCFHKSSGMSRRENLGSRRFASIRQGEVRTVSNTPIHSFTFFKT